MCKRKIPTGKSAKCFPMKVSPASAEFQMTEVSSDEREDVQKKTFTKWINAQFSKFGKQHIDNLFSDLQDGKRLLDLLEGLTGQKLPKEKGSTRVHALNNVNKALRVLQKNNVSGDLNRVCTP
ncbi:dystrophin-like [Arvicanthis niloticus]|uniref:dystrophin-like n=1 Tax=Arvicanthis niloticus TaxID=61156 RepID=UPI00402B8FC9